MPLQAIDFPALPECGGAQWTVANIDELAELTARILLGRARHVASILHGAIRQPLDIPKEELRNSLRRQLILQPGAQPWHRDGLLFEIICWIAAQITAGPDEVISDPHLQSTQQGVDSLKVSFDRRSRRLQTAKIYEQKCTDNPRTHFRDNVLPAFRDWLTGKRDAELVQLAVGLLDRFSLSDQETEEAYNRLIQDRPLQFETALTVSPAAFPVASCMTLFKDFSSLQGDVTTRFGVTFPLDDLRPWFEGFAQRVYAYIGAADV
ncbi:MAG: hypothetical protein WA624_03325 [Methylocella sp.]